jgi:hypothetical protein
MRPVQRDNDWVSRFDECRRRDERWVGSLSDLCSTVVGVDPLGLRLDEDDGLLFGRRRAP